jgi:UDP-N-acetyl-D-mannosaminuronate dehydrogenase
VGTTVAYLRKYQPALTIINSTVPPGTTRMIAERSGAAVAYSPVRGKHVKMQQDMMHYKKFVGAGDPEITARAAAHFEAAGFKTDRFPNSETGELAKLLETTWLGMLIGWAQEIERIGSQYGATYDDLNAFIKEISFLPHHTFPGVIGGHCVMANIAILRERMQSDFLDALVKSNQRKQQEQPAAAKTGNIVEMAPATRPTLRETEEDSEREAPARVR